MRIQKKWHNNQRIDGGRILVEIKVEVAVVYGRTDITIVNGKGTKPQTVVDRTGTRHYIMLFVP
jgi:hypothetical protein